MSLLLALSKEHFVELRIALLHREAKWLTSKLTSGAPKEPRMLLQRSQGELCSPRIK